MKKYFPRVFNYISLSKVESLEKELEKIEGGGFNIFGIGGSLKISRQQSLQERINNIIDNVTGENENFKRFSGEFIEVIMEDVVIYVCVTNKETIIMGGSSVYTQFNQKRIPPINFIGGSNRTSLVRRMTEWWEEYSIRKGIITDENIKTFKTTWKDYDPNNPTMDVIKFARKPNELDEIAKWMYKEYSNTHFIGNMEMISIIYSDTIIKSNIDDKLINDNSKRLIIGTPVYVSQISPKKD